MPILSQRLHIKVHDCDSDHIGKADYASRQVGVGEFRPAGHSAGSDMDVRSDYIAVSLGMPVVGDDLAMVAIIEGVEVISDANFPCTPVAPIRSCAIAAIEGKRDPGGTVQSNGCSAEVQEMQVVVLLIASSIDMEGDGGHGRE